jgi:nucleoside-diphosphate-sugar epimerase
MRVLIFGASGMVGQSALLACMRDQRVLQITAIGRTATGRSHPKPTELMHANMALYNDILT